MERKRYRHACTHSICHLPTYATVVFAINASHLHEHWRVGKFRLIVKRGQTCPLILWAIACVRAWLKRTQIMRANPSSAREQLGFNQTHMRKRCALIFLEHGWRCGSNVHAHIMNELLHDRAPRVSGVRGWNGNICALPPNGTICVRVFPRCCLTQSQCDVEYMCIIRAWLGQLKCECVCAVAWPWVAMRTEGVLCDFLSTFTDIQFKH